MGHLSRGPYGKSEMTTYQERMISFSQDPKFLALGSLYRNLPWIFVLMNRYGFEMPPPIMASSWHFYLANLGRSLPLLVIIGLISKANFELGLFLLGTWHTLLMLATDRQRDLWMALGKPNWATYASKPENCCKATELE